VPKNIVAQVGEAGQAQQPRPRKASPRKWARVPAAVLLASELLPLDKVVFGTLMLFANRKSNACWPSRRLLAELLGVHPSTVQRSLSRLESLGFLSTESRGPGRARLRRLSPRPDGAQAQHQSCMDAPSDGAPMHQGWCAGAPFNDAQMRRMNHKEGKNQGVCNQGVVEEPRTICHHQVLDREDKGSAGAGARGEAPRPGPQQEALVQREVIVTLPPGSPLARLERAVERADGILQAYAEAQPVDFRERLSAASALSARLRAFLRRAEEALDGLVLDALVDAHLGAYDEEPTREKLLARFERLCRASRFSLDELEEATEECYQLLRASKFLLAGLATALSRPFWPDDGLAGAAVRGAEELTGLSGRESWKVALEAALCELTQLVKDDQGCWWRVVEQQKVASLAKSFPELSSYIAAVRRNGHRKLEVDGP